MHQAFRWMAQLATHLVPARSLSDAHGAGAGAGLGGAASLRRLCLLSHVDSYHISELLVASVVDSAAAPPLPLSLLLQLSLQCRTRLAYKLGDLIAAAPVVDARLSQGRGRSTPPPGSNGHGRGRTHFSYPSGAEYPPSTGLLETYARCVLTAPSSLYRVGGTMASQLVERLRDPALLSCGQGDKPTSTALQVTPSHTTQCTSSAPRSAPRSAPTQCTTQCTMRCTMPCR